MFSMYLSCDIGKYFCVIKCKSIWCVKKTFNGSGPTLSFIFEEEREEDRGEGEGVGDLGEGSESWAREVKGGEKREGEGSTGWGCSDLVLLAVWCFEERTIRKKKIKKNNLKNTK